MSNVTRILNAIERGDAKAIDEFLPLVYEELRILTAQKLYLETPGQTLPATTLVHEAYIRLVGEESPGWSLQDTTSALTYISSNCSVFELNSLLSTPPIAQHAP